LSSSATSTLSHLHLHAALVNAPFTYILVPFLVLAVYQLAFFFSENFSHHPLWQQHGGKAYTWLVQHKQQALLLIAQTEIMNGFTLLATLILPSRRPLLMLMVWQVLRLRYWSVDAAIHHRQVCGCHGMLCWSWLCWSWQGVD
jgi:hypothetical protein